jgi:glycogen debranching enzyme
MTKINIYEGNSFTVTRSGYVTSTTLTAFDVTLTIKQNKEDTSEITIIDGVVSGQGVVFTVPAMEELSKGIYYFEVTAETTSQKVTLEQDRIFVRESIVYVT